MELAGGDLRLPVGAPELVVDNLLPVQPMLDVRTLDDDPRRVPFAERLDDASGRLVERVCGGRGSQTFLPVRRIRIVEQLILRRAPVDVIVLARAAVEDPAVAALPDLPLEFELEIAEFLPRDEIIDGAILRQRVATQMPAIRSEEHTSEL